MRKLFKSKLKVEEKGAHFELSNIIFFSNNIKYNNTLGRNKILAMDLWFYYLYFLVRLSFEQTIEE